VDILNPHLPGGGLVRDPVYHQLHRALLGLIGERGFGPGERFLTEREVCRRFGVSRPTANKALSTLVAAGILEFRRGVGTFVRGGGLALDLRGLVSFTGRAESLGLRPSTRVLGFGTLPPGRVPTEAARALRGGEEGAGPVFFMERLRRADGIPVILERRYVESSFCPGLRREDLAGSLYALWTERWGLRIGGVDQAIRAVRLGAREARLLGTARGAAALLVAATGFLEGGRPLWFERTLYRGDAYEFQNRVEGAGPAAGRSAWVPAGRSGGIGDPRRKTWITPTATSPR